MQSFLKTTLVILAILGFLAVGTACTEDSGSGAEVPSIQGPALIMFYTEG